VSRFSGRRGFAGRAFCCIHRVSNCRDYNRATWRQLAFLHQQPQHGPQNQGDQNSGSDIFSDRHIALVSFPVSEILLAIAPIPRREQGDFFSRA
jgi:hypothetical protein